MTELGEALLNDTQTAIKPTPRTHGRLTSQQTLERIHLLHLKRFTDLKSDLKMNYKSDQKRHSQKKERMN